MRSQVRISCICYFFACKLTRSPASPEFLAGFDQLIESMRKVKPDAKGPMDPTTSVTAVRKIIDRATIADTGCYVSHKGDKNWL